MCVWQAYICYTKFLNTIRLKDKVPAVHVVVNSRDHMVLGICQIIFSWYAAVYGDQQFSH